MAGPYCRERSHNGGTRDVRGMVGRFPWHTRGMSEAVAGWVWEENVTRLLRHPRY